MGNKQEIIDRVLGLMPDDKGIYADPKGSIQLQNKFIALCNSIDESRTPYYEWMRKLTVRDKPPRGKCAKYFEVNSSRRPALAAVRQSTSFRNLNPSGHLK